MVACLPSRHKISPSKEKKKSKRKKNKQINTSQNTTDTMVNNYDEIIPTIQAKNHGDKFILALSKNKQKNLQGKK